MIKKVLVTGAEGFIGSHLTEALIRNGYEVKAFVLYNSFNKWGWLEHCDSDVKGSFEVFLGDVRDYHGVKTAMMGCDAVIHLAALIAIPYSYHSPDTYIETNVKGTLNIVQAARDLQVSKVIHTSTSEVYGTAKYTPIDELHPLQGQSPYSASKIGADKIAESFYHSFNTPIVTVRPFNAYGPRQSARAVIPTIISQIVSGREKITLGALSPTRDFNFVLDLVDGFIQALETTNGIGEAFNLGSNFEISIEKTAQLIASLMDVQIEIILDKERFRPKNSEVQRLWANDSKAKKILSWNPSLSGMDGFKIGLSKTINWFSDPVNLSYYKSDIYNI